MTIGTNQTTIAGGGPDDYLEARHVLLRGTNREIGQAIGEIARTEFDVQPLGPIDPIRARAARRYFREHYPIHEQRLLGAADAYGIAEGDEGANFVGLPYLLPPLPGCSVAYIPPAKTANGGGLLTRNLDFPLEFGAAPPDDDRLGESLASKGSFKSASRPYLFEVHPDEGYPSHLARSFKAHPVEIQSSLVFHALPGNHVTACHFMWVTCTTCLPAQMASTPKDSRSRCSQTTSRLLAILHRRSRSPASASTRNR